MYVFMACVLFQTVHVRWRTGTDLTPMCMQWDLCWMMVPPEPTTLAVVSNTPNHSHQSMVRQPISSNSSVHLCVLVALYEYGIVLLLLKVNHYLYIFHLLLLPFPLSLSLPALSYFSLSPLPFAPHLLTDSQQSMQEWMTVVDAAIQGVPEQASRRRETISCKYREKKV